jgi:outer membrane protein assembly factor BamB
LEARTGRTIWSREITADSGALPPQWGYATSPLVTAGVAIVFAGGSGGKSVLGYRADDGQLVWSAGDGEASYSSPQAATLDGVEQVLMASGRGMAAFEPKRGGVLWEHVWAPADIVRVVQPHHLDEGIVLLGTGQGYGTRQLRVRREGDAWTVEPGWTTNALKPYFNDFVSHDGFLYGFDENIFCCVDAQTGKRRWKGGRYGYGQVLLVEDQGLLLVLSESGEVLLLEANPERHVERARFAALSGKTWNHPVLAHGKLYVRNAEEAACYDLAATDF